MKIPKVKSVGEWYGEVKHPGHAPECKWHRKIEFNDTKELREFINSKSQFFCHDNGWVFENNLPLRKVIHYYKIKKLIRTRQLWIVADVEQTTLREINLEILTT